MKRDYSLKRIGENWRLLPEDERRRKFDYDTLLNNIKRRELRIQKEIQRLNQLKLELNEWKKKRTSEFNYLIKYHKNIQPTFTFSMSKSRKVKKSSLTTGLFITGGNKSWDCFVKIGNYRKVIYLGTNSDVCLHLDLIEGREGYYRHLNTLHKREHYDKVVQKLDSLIKPLILESLYTHVESGKEIQEWFGLKIFEEGVLQSIYKLSEYYSLPVVEEKRETRGLFWGFENGKPVFKKRKKK